MAHAKPSKVSNLGHTAVKDAALLKATNEWKKSLCLTHIAEDFATRYTHFHHCSINLPFLSSSPIGTLGLVKSTKQIEID